MGDRDRSGLSELADPKDLEELLQTSSRALARALGITHSYTGGRDLLEICTATTAEDI